jgi:hypothetical protein
MVTAGTVVESPQTRIAFERTPSAGALRPRRDRLENAIAADEAIWAEVLAFDTEWAEAGEITRS